MVVKSMDQSTTRLSLWQGGPLPGGVLFCHRKILMKQVYRSTFGAPIDLSRYNWIVGGPVFLWTYNVSAIETRSVTQLLML